MCTVDCFVPEYNAMIEEVHLPVCVNMGFFLYLMFILEI